MFDLTDQQFGLLAVFTIFVLPFIILGIVGLVLEVRDRAYARGFDEAYSKAVRAVQRGQSIV